jgi:hypothetical protein
MVNIVARVTDTSLSGRRYISELKWRVYRSEVRTQRGVCCYAEFACIQSIQRGGRRFLPILCVRNERIALFLLHYVSKFQHLNINDVYETIDK